MTKTIILGIVVAAAFVAGMFAFMTVNQASAGAGSIGEDATERDNTTVTDIKLKNGQRLVLLDNAGIGGTSDVEVTWRFDSTECGLNRVDTPAGIVLSPFSPAGDDGALGGNPAHNDEFAVKGIVLFAKPGETCELKGKKGEFVTVSTVGSSS